MVSKADQRYAEFVEAESHKPYAKANRDRMLKIQDSREAAGPFRGLDDDDPDLERLVRAHAQRKGLDPDELLAQEVQRRQAASANGATDLPAKLVDRYGSADEQDEASEDGPTATTQGAGSAGGAKSGKATGTPSPSRSAAGSFPTPTLSPSWGDGSGFALGLVLYCLGLNYIRYGPAGVKGWLSAKFLNRPATTLVDGLAAGDTTTSGKGTGVPTGGSGTNRAF